MAEVEVKRVQETLLKMAKTIAGILEANDIPYMIAFGTLLGAVRHKGFIPWDDDFDFYLFDESYDKAIEILRDNLPKDMFLEDEKSEPLFFHAWAHVKDVYSIAECQEYPQDSLYQHKGISVDIYRTKKMPLNELKEFLNRENEKYLERRKVKGLIDEEDLKIRLENLEKDKYFADSHPEASTELVYNLGLSDVGAYMKPDTIFPLKRYSFEGNLFWGPAEGDTILTKLYNNYMELPPIAQRKTHYSSVEFIEHSEKD